MRNVNDDSDWDWNTFIGGFILTMRNVNCSKLLMLISPFSGFILTMRNVNDEVEEIIK